ncbi:hypothetical protein HPB48_020429 [Haemaphysalis longicornis]|uniref:Uncharacterized protein n=1 Tax=Haemaphysalis longicornis TaxID=44386 RepID=A0A9J6GVF4_HAELO|nr:hypothetical protein HPB48_020429 [Haemaphysalis longicornis]
MDNASYHSRRLETITTMSSRKPDILLADIKGTDDGSPNNWAKAVEHVIGIEDKRREARGFSDHVEPIIISLGEEDGDSCGSADDDLSGIEPME